MGWCGYLRDAFPCVHTAAPPSPTFGLRPHFLCRSVHHSIMTCNSRSTPPILDSLFTPSSAAERTNRRTLPHTGWGERWGCAPRR